MAKFRLPQFGHGGDYNPDQWLDRPDILSQDIEYMKEAFELAKEKGALKESEWKDMAVNGFNIGWEVSNLAKVGVKIENMSLKVVEYE